MKGRSSSPSYGHRCSGGALALLYALVVAECSAAVIPASCFGSSMVLQRQMSLPVWGAAAPMEKVTVRLGTVSAETVADGRGRWRVVLPPQEAASEPQMLVVRGRDDEVRFTDVLIGEVWLCAGQSNMQMPLEKTLHAARAMAAAQRPGMRLLSIETAAGGSGVYTAAQIEDLVPQRFAKGSWTRCSAVAARHFSAVGYHFGVRLQETLDVPVGLICVAVGGAPTEAWVSRDGLIADPQLAPLVSGDWLRNPALAGWCQERGLQTLARALRDGDAIPGDAAGPNHPFKPGFLWNACIEPLAAFGIRGVVWYQGESNADAPARVQQHAGLFRALVGDWRHHWRREDLPFVCVQLPGMNRPEWPAFRETQRRAIQKLRHAGMAVTIDLGSRDDVHPPDKQPVSDRLARWALAEVYGRRDVVASGPQPAGADFRSDGSVVIHFDHAAGLTTVDDGSPRHFEIMGEAGTFRPTDARIEGGTVVVEPVGGRRGAARAVRYAWLPFPEPSVNVVNAARLPAVPFMIDRSDVAGDGLGTGPND